MNYKYFIMEVLEKNKVIQKNFNDYFKLKSLETINQEVKVDSELTIPSINDELAKFLSCYNNYACFEDKTSLDTYPLVLNFEETYSLDFLSKKFRLLENKYLIDLSLFKKVADDHLNNLSYFLQNFYSADLLNFNEINKALQVTEGKKLVDFKIWDSNDLSKEYDLLEKIDPNYSSIILFVKLYSYYDINWKNLNNYIKSLDLPSEMKVYFIFIISDFEEVDDEEEEEEESK
jgi:hypothetical protein